jgi:hypothetical protein
VVMNALGDAVDIRWEIWRRRPDFLETQTMFVVCNPPMKRWGTARPGERRAQDSAQGNNGGYGRCVQGRGLAAQAGRQVLYDTQWRRAWQGWCGR